MTSSRLEAFSDGVIAIIITIMVLELRAPEDASLNALRPLLPVLMSYLLSYVYLGIYWNNHHHLLKAVKRVDGRIMWANLHLLFWLSLFPFVTSWMDESYTQAWPVATYGAVFFMAAVAYYILQSLIVAQHEKESVLKAAFRADWKGKLSPLLYLLAIGLAFVRPWLSTALYVLVAALWVVPDGRLESK